MQPSPADTFPEPESENRVAGWPRGQILYGDGPPYPEWSESVVCIGTFDGVHLGHRAVIHQALKRAREIGQPAGVITFDRHPAEILAPQYAPPAISSLGEKLRLLLDEGPEFVLVLQFDERLRDTSAQEFIDRILVKKARAKELVIGHDFAMGRGREGNGAWLAAQMPTQIVEPCEVGGLRVSSSLVRKSVKEGDLEAANRFLGRPYAIEGVVVGGDRIGRELGYPTANLARLGGLVTPAEGVYVARAATPWGSFMAGLSIGTRPTVDGADLAIEAFLVDYPGEPIYGRLIRIELLKFLRKQERFSSLEALKSQIALDVEAVKNWKS